MGAVGSGGISSGGLASGLSAEESADTLTAASPARPLENQTPPSSSRGAPDSDRKNRRRSESTQALPYDKRRRENPTASENDGGSQNSASADLASENLASDDSLPHQLDDLA